MRLLICEDVFSTRHCVWLNEQKIALKKNFQNLHEQIETIIAAEQEVDLLIITI